MSDNIKVVVKVRPLISREIEDKLSYRWRVKSDTLWQLDQNGRETEVCFTFDKVYDKETKTPEVYNDIAKPIVEAAIAGFNGTIFAYGQTSSGKTYTMTGTEQSPGIIPLAVLNLFDTIKTKKDRDFLVRVSYIEIYNETLKDLLNVEKKNIKIHDTLQGVKVDCSEKVTGSPEEVLEAMKEGEANRQTGATNMNEESSRSHSIFQITIESREHVDGEDEESGCVNVSQLNLVDLAGSERAGQTGATGIRFKEGTHINKSLSSLALVIKQLSEDPNKYANYRDSKLTRILQNSLGGNAKTSIICAITPASVEETISTLQFANRAKSIKNKPEVNAVATNATMIQSLTKQLSKLQSELAAKRNLEVMLQSSKNVEQELQSKIATLQKMILNGFGQFSAMEFSRRKAAAPRRVTISTLHHIPEEPVAKSNIPKFCTPSLKYNPLNVPGSSDFAPIQSGAAAGPHKLATVPEEARPVTPPPAAHVVGFRDEVIEINSDDDSMTETRCSPYHKCYGASKTPPCVLRKNAKLAEESLKDIVELTGRERIYTPSVIELMEKLETNTNIITQLQEEVDSLKEKTKEKDAKIEELTSKVQITEDLVNTITSAKSELEVQCKEKDTKLTDFEVSYETLVSKSKTRELELLSLLEEQQRSSSRLSIDKPKKMESEMVNFLDMSRDMTLVHSDTDTSSTTLDDGAARLHDLVHNLQAELAAKTQLVIDLEADIYKHKQQIENLDTSSQKLQTTIDDFKTKLADIETENSYLKCTIDNLNSTIESHKKNLESADRDIESYNSTIQELQIQLNKKEIVPSIKVNDSIIDSMIANEQKCIANNDNIKNIIRSLKELIENKNCEIENLKSTIASEKENSATQITLKKELEIKENRIVTLLNEAETLKHELNINLNEINKLLEVEKNLTDRLTTIQEENKILEQQKIENDQKIENLQSDLDSLTCKIEEKEIKTQNIVSENQELSKQIEDMNSIITDLTEDLLEKNEENEQLTRTVSDKEIDEKNIIGKNQELSKQIEYMTNRITDLEQKWSEKNIENEKLTRLVADKEISEQTVFGKNQDLTKQVEDMAQKIEGLEINLKEKDKTIASVNDRDEDIQINLAKAKSILFKIQDIALKLKSTKEDLPETFNDLGVVLEIMNTKVITIDNSATQSLQTISELEEHCSSLSSEKESQFSMLRAEDEQLNNQLTAETETLTQKTYDLIEDLNKTRAELQSKEEEINKLEEKLDKALSICKDVERKSQEHLNKSFFVLRRLHNIACKLNRGIVTPPDTIDNYDTLFELFHEKLNILDASVIQILRIAYNMQDKLIEFTDEKETEIANFESQIERINSDMAIQTLQVSQRTLHLIEELKKSRADLEAKNEQIVALEIELNDVQEINKNLRNGMISKDNSITSLHDKLSAVYAEIETLRNMNMGVDKLEELLQAKYLQVKHLEDQLANGVDSLEDKYRDVTNGLSLAIQKRDMLLAEILKKAVRVARQCGIDSSEISETYEDDVYERVVVILDKIGMSVALLKTENDVERSDIENMLTMAKEEIEKLTAMNMKIMNDNEDIKNKNQELSLEVEETKKLNIDLSSSTKILEQLNLELRSKSDEITNMEGKLIDLKEKFNNYEHAMKEQMSELEAENNELKNKNKDGLLLDFSEKLSKPLANVRKNANSSNTPQSLITICCNKIIEAIQHQDPDLSATTCSLTTTSSKISIPTENIQTQTDSCDCESLALKLTQVMEENAKLVDDLEAATKENLEVVDLLEDLQATNDYLLKEREEVKKEIQLLVEPAIELQKKIVNHRTNLSTLTATTYAENKLLNSQLKVLKHHHTRYIHVCQRDLPAFKTQLSELMTILKESSLNDKQNASFKRYSLPDVLDNSASTSAFKNESTLDGDLLMMDTNLTLTTVDNTLVGADQTCLDVTQVNFDANETACQTNDISKMIDPYILYTQMETLTTENQKLSEQIESLQQENTKLKEEVLNFISPSVSYKDAQSSPIKMNGVNDEISKDVDVNYCCQNCQEIKEELTRLENTLNKEMKQLSTELEVLTSEKESIQEKYTNIILEIPSTEALLRKLSNTEKESLTKSQEINKLTNDLNKKNKIIKELQDENDTLSVQVMDNISEADTLKKELDEIKDTNTELMEKLKSLEQLAKQYETEANNEKPCSHCIMKDEMIMSLQLEHSKLTRSLSDSETSSRHNKICTLQHELHASKEDCKKITEEVATIKNHLERSNVSVCQAMDLDESMGDSSIYAISEDLTTASKNTRSILSDQSSNVYQNDKLDCFNYYIDIIGSEKEVLDDNVKIIDIMKAFYKNLVAKHGDEVDNLLNKLKDFEESKTQLQAQLTDVNTEHSKITEALHESQNNIKTVTNILDRVKSNINLINEEISNVVDVDKNSRLVTLFKENLLKVLDSEFSLSCVNIFESVIDSIVTKHEKDISDIVEKYTELQNHMESVVTEFNSVNENLTLMKSQLSDKENDYNLLKAQKEKVYEISNAVTLDIVKREQELKNMLNNGYKKLLELDLIDLYNIEANLSLTENFTLLFDSVITKNLNGSSKLDGNNDNLIIEVNNLKTTIEEKENVIITLQEKISQCEKDLHNQRIHEEIYENKVKENQTHIETIEILTKELAALKEEMLEKEKKYMELESLKSEEMVTQSSSEQTTTSKDCESCGEFFTKLECCRQDYDNLKTLHDMIMKEKETCAAELEKAKEIIAKNKAELDKMTADILVLRESVTDNVSIIQTLTLEAKSMMEQNVQLKKQFDDKSLEVSRLEMNIKTHEKTAQIQNKMITRLQKSREDEENLGKEKDRQIDDLTQKCTTLQKECEIMKNELKAARDAVDNLKNKKDSLEAKIADLEINLNQDGHKRRLSIDAIAEASRRRRQSLHDTKRAFAEEFDANKIEEVFDSRAKPDDLFMDIDEDSSSRSTPIRSSRGRDSLRHDDEESTSTSRPSSVTQTRRRRQSIHDQRRSMARRTPSPDSMSSFDKPNNLSAGDTHALDAVQLRERLAATQRELEDLKERYRELDEECETCAQYLQERDEQCRKLKKDKIALEQRVTELIKCDPNRSAVTPTFAHAAVNTDEDWANLHSVVVDRMSFDAEVEKNKKLSRTIEELRCNKQELKKTIEKMQKALEKNAAFMHSKELDSAKRELAECKGELAELQQRYRELDEECETCAQYLRERDEQCRKLKEAKHALETKLEELQGDVSNAAVSARRRRQSAHDHNRSLRPHHAADKQTETSDDLLSYQVERDDNALRATNAHIQELQRVKLALDRAVREKAALEKQGSAAPHALCVATGSAIVQNQQFTDIMKENQKLKKMNSKLISICKKRGKQHHDRENEEPSAGSG